MAIDVHLANFDGPLDLLLHLIKSNEMDINDIQMVEITEQYLAVIEQMKQLDLDIAGEFLLMAATLIHIKSKLLLPVSEEILEEEEEDPRAELVRRLLEYQRYKEAAESLERLPQLGRDQFVGHFLPPELLADEAEDEFAVGIYQLARVFHQLLTAAPAEVFHEVVREPLSVADHIQLVLERLRGGARLGFHELFTARPQRAEVVVTFLATLELVKMRMIRIEQAAEFRAIWLRLAVTDSAGDGMLPGEETLGYG